MSLDTSMQLRVASVFIILVASAVGICFPLLVDTNNKMFRLLNAGSAGVMLGLALMHLIPEANEVLEEEMPGYSWAFALTCAGVILVLTVEQVVFVFASGINSERKKSCSSDDGKPMGSIADMHNEECGITHCEHTKMESNFDHDHSHAHEHQHGQSCSSAAAPAHHIAHTHCAATAPHAGCEHGAHGHEEEEAAILKSVLQATDLRALVTAYIMEASIAIHSIIIGVDLGMLSDSGDVPTLLSLLAALTFHQFVEGAGLGTAIANTRVSLGNAKMMGFIGIFALTMPVGIVIGILTSHGSENHDQLVGKGVASCLAAGSLLYVSLTEMVGSYFHAHDLQKQPLLKLGMTFSFALGVIIMAIIAIWA